MRDHLSGLLKPLKPLKARVHLATNRLEKLLLGCDKIPTRWSLIKKTKLLRSLKALFDVIDRLFRAERSLYEARQEPRESREELRNFITLKKKVRELREESLKAVAAVHDVSQITQDLEQLADQITQDLEQLADQKTQDLEQLADQKTQDILTDISKSARVYAWELQDYIEAANTYEDKLTEYYKQNPSLAPMRPRREYQFHMSSRREQQGGSLSYEARAKIEADAYRRKCLQEVRDAMDAAKKAKGTKEAKASE
jgi:uncharacterized phage infection (PIP) family protein YhgE